MDSTQKYADTLVNMLLEDSATMWKQGNDHEAYTIRNMAHTVRGISRQLNEIRAELNKPVMEETPLF